MTGWVTEVTEERPGALKLRVSPSNDPGDSRPALCYPDLTGGVEVGDRVLLNTTAVDLNLGTGGWDFVIANLTRCERESRSTFGEETAGHLIKMRYAPHQIAVQAAEEAVPDLPENLEGRPVLIAELHSQIAPALVGLKLAADSRGVPYPRVAYLMPDTASLPLALSDLLPRLRAQRLLHATITCGQAFGGEYEAVTLGSGMAVAVGPAACDLLLIAQGPGNAGTGSALGFGGLYMAEAAHLAFALGGDPILVARASGADPRPRHRGISHHIHNLIERLLLAPVTLPLASPSDPGHEGTPESKREAHPYDLPSSERCRIEWVAEAPLLDALRGADLPLRSMGRNLEDDPVFFTTAAAAGWVAGQRYALRLQKGPSR